LALRSLAPVQRITVFVATCDDPNSSRNAVLIAFANSSGEMCLVDFGNSLPFLGNILQRLSR
jgi:hypothetical protein